MGCCWEEGGGAPAECRTQLAVGSKVTFKCVWIESQKSRGKKLCRFCLGASLARFETLQLTSFSPLRDRKHLQLDLLSG